MDAEIITVGTELLLGEVLNTNATYLSQQLANLGINVYYQSVVGDNEKRLKETIKIAASRSNLIIITGGLGPTRDDITKRVVANFLGKELVKDKKAAEKVIQYFKTENRKMTENNMLQALHIAGSIPLKNINGLAVGDFYEDKSGTCFILLPGPPKELQMMFSKFVQPLIKKKYLDGYLKSRVLRFYGIGEASLADLLDDLIENQTNPTLALYAKNGEVILRITAHSQNKATLAELLNEVENKVVKIAGEYLYGYGENNSLANVLFEKLADNNLTITAAESLTGGLFQATLTEISGASKFFRGGFVTYSNEVKALLLNIPQAIIDEYGVVSKQVADWMALQSQKILQTDIAISFTGIAGPNGLENKDVGLVYIGIRFKDNSEVYKFKFLGSRKQIRKKCVLKGIYLINNMVETLNKKGGSNG